MIIKKLLLSIVFITYAFLIFGQNLEEDFIKHGFGVKVQTIFTYPYQDRVYTTYDPGLDIELNTVITGIHGEVNYYFIPYFGMGIGGGYEIITQPKITYFPLYVNFIGIISEEKNTWYAKMNFGNHYGKIAKRGFIFRAGLGLRVKVYEDILSYFELTYSFQNIYKSFEQSTRPINYYNIESIGITIGIGLN